MPDNRYDDGFSTVISFENLPSVKIFEKEVTPPGITAGGPIDTTTMRNTTWRTMSPRQLVSLTAITVTVAYAFSAYENLVGQIRVNQQITITFPDNSTITFWGWIEEFTPGANTEGEQPTATVTIQPSNHDNNDVEQAPAFDLAST